MQPVRDELSYSVRRKLIARERVRRLMKDWGPWERMELPHGVPNASSGWPMQVRHVVRNAVFGVLIRPCGGGIHLAISSISGARPMWHEMQRIKNELVGEGVTAVEIYPPQAQIVDAADMFHLWARAGDWFPVGWSIFEGAPAPVSGL